MCGSSSPEKGRRYIGIRLACLACLRLLGGVWLEFIWPVWAIGVVGVQFVPRARLMRSMWVLDLMLGRIHSMGIFDAVYVGAFAFIPRAHLMRSTWVLGLTLGRACVRFDCVGHDGAFS
jgi:hypothetical protein